jgi:serine/threonine protein kinase
MMTGQSISHYRILEKLGEGGMGVVYKGEDTRLRRTVALKFLPSHALENRERFLREAQSGAALNHPNICTIFEIDEENGFLAMELIDGMSVKNKIAARPLPLEEALDIAMQVCAGLQAAHENGIVHRDIKPANLMLTTQGQVKIMDFGLAQVGDRTRLTKPGSSLGTPAYMSPEQSKGEAVDRRTDIWSLGVVLYEMIAGKLPFRGETEQAVSYGIVHAEPEPLTALRSGLPLELDRIAAKALAKASRDRYQNVEDLLVDLRRVKLKQPSAVRTLSYRRTVLFSAGAAAVAGAGYWLKTTLLPNAPATAVNVVIPIPDGAATADAGRMLGPPVVSPDGSAVVVSLSSKGTSHLFIRRLDANRVTLLEGTAGASYPFWSPDSRSIAFFAGAKLRRIPASGGASESLCDAPNNRGGSWGRNRDIVFGINMHGLFRVSDSGGARVEITQLDRAAGENSHRYPVFLPDGNRFLYFARADNLERRGVYLESLDRKTPRRRLLIADGQFALALDPHSGRHSLLSQQAGKIVGHPFDVASGQLVGEPRVLVDQSGQVSASNTGVLVLRTEQQDLCRLVWVDRAGAEKGSIGATADYWQVELSPGDRYATIVKHDYLSGQFDVWLASLPDGPLDPLSDSPFVGAPVWSPDGTAIYYVQFRKGNVLRRVANPRGPEEVVLNFPPQEECELRDISPDGRYFAMVRKSNTEARTAGWTSVAKYEWTPIAGGASPQFSPDGRWLVFSSNQTGADEIYVSDFPRTVHRHRVSAAGGSEPRWRADGREIVFVDGEGRMMSAEITPGTEFRSLPPKPLFQAGLRRGSDTLRYDVTQDGQRFLLITGRESAGSGNIEMILNWPSLLRERK